MNGTIPGRQIRLVRARNVGRGDPDAVHYPLPPSGVLNYDGLSSPPTPQTPALGPFLLGPLLQI